MKRFVLLLSLAIVVMSFGVFKDVPRNHWAYQAIEYLYNIGVITGQPGGNFEGGKALTRYEAAVMIYRAIRYVEKKISGPEAGTNVISLAKKAYEMALSNSNKIEAIQSDVNAIKKKIIDLDTGSIKASIEELNKMKGDIEALVRNFENKFSTELGEIKDKTDQAFLQASRLARDYADLNRKVEELSRQIGGIFEDLSNLKSKQVGTQQVPLDLADLQNQLSNLKRDLNSANVKMTAISDEVNNLKRRVDVNVDDINSLKVSVKGLESKLKGLEEKIAQISVSLSALSPLSKRVGNLENDLSTLKRRISDMEIELSQLKKSLPAGGFDMEGILSEIDSKLDERISKSIDKLKVEILESVKTDVESILENKIDDIKNSVLSDFRNELNSAREDLSSDIMALDKKFRKEISELKNGVVRNSEYIKTINAKLSQINMDIDNLKAMKSDLDSVLSRVEEVERKVSEYGKNYSEMAKKVEDSINSFKSEIDSFKEKIGEIVYLKEKVNDISKSLVPVSRIESLENKVRDISDKVSSLDSRISKVEASIVDITGNYKSLKSEVEGIKSEIENKISNLSIKVDKLDERISGLETFGKDLDSLNANLKKFQTDVYSKFNSIDEQIQNLESKKADGASVIFAILMSIIGVALGGAALYMALSK